MVAISVARCAAVLITAAHLCGAHAQDLIAPLADAYRRIDPSADGWKTEALYEGASLALAPLKSALAADTPIPFPEATATGLVPDPSLAITRPGFEICRSPASPGVVPFAEAIAGLQSRFDRNKIPRTELKIVGITPLETGFVTEILAHFHGTSSGNPRQINARWTVTWSDRETPAHLSATQLEEVTATTSTPLFQEATGSVFKDLPAFNEQFAYPADHWRLTIPSNLGIDPVANHGLAVGDVNGDGLEDLYVCAEGGLPNRLLLREPDGSLTDATAESNAGYLDYSASALIVDLDNDGDRDLVVALELRVLFLDNDGKGRFELAFGIGTRAQAFSLAAADFDLDADLDIYVCGYNPPGGDVRRGAMGEPVPYHDANNGGANMLLKNAGDWTFDDHAPALGLDENNTRFSFAAAWEDFDLDGDPDLYVANDYGRNNLYRNDGGTFTDVAAELGVEDTSAGMSVSWDDINRDGIPDLYVSNMFSAAGNRITTQSQFKSNLHADTRQIYQRHARGNTLFLGGRDGSFTDVSESARVTMGRWAWGSRFADFNNDGWSDILVANGFISAPEDTGDL